MTPEILTDSLERPGRVTVRPVPGSGRRPPRLDPPRPARSAPRAQATDRRDRVDPTHAVFEATSAVAAGRRQSVRHVPRLLWTHRAALARLARTVRDLPTVQVEVPDGPAGHELTEQMQARVGGLPLRRWAVAHLEIPSDPGAYRRGRSRKMVRAHAKRAVLQGVRAVTLDGRADVVRAFTDIVVDGWGTDAATVAEWIRNVEPTPWTHCAAARTADGRAIVFSKVVVAGPYARLHTFIRDRDDERSSPARYLLMEHLVEQLRAQGVRHVFADTVLGLPAGLRFQQKKMGFDVRNVRVSRRRLPRR